MEDIRPIENKNFIDNFIEEDLAAGGRFEGKKVHTRFPPEPNGYLHIGHCKALTIDFGTAEKFGGLCNLRMDDTNPTKEDTEYVDAIQADIHWLGFDWGDRFFYGSDYFEKDYAVFNWEKAVHISGTCHKTGAGAAHRQGRSVSSAQGRCHPLHRRG